MDLETYRLAHGLSYAKLADKLELNWKRHARRWALGESWPNVDGLKRIIQATGGQVTLNAMYQRRLQFLESQAEMLSASEASGAHGQVGSPPDGCPAEHKNQNPPNADDHAAPSGADRARDRRESTGQAGYADGQKSHGNPDRAA